MAEPEGEQRGALQWCCCEQVSSCPCPPATLFLPAAVRLEMPHPFKASPSFYLPPFLINLPFFKLAVLVSGLHFLVFPLLLPALNSLDPLCPPLRFSHSPSPPCVLFPAHPFPSLALLLFGHNSFAPPTFCHFLPLSAGPFPSQFYQLYPSCFPHFSLATIHTQGHSQGCHWALRPELLRICNEKTYQSHSGKKAEDWAGMEN